MADDELFGADGTQPLSAPEPLTDPLAGLVTGFLFADNTATPTVSSEEPVARARAQAEVARRRIAEPTRPVRSSAPGAVVPEAIPLAESLPSRSRQARRPDLEVRPAQPAPVRPAQPAGQAAMSRPTAMPAPAIRTRRTAGLGCAMFVIIAVLLIVVFVVLGAVFGHGSAGFFNG